MRAPSPEQWQRIEPLVDRLLDLEGEERASLIERSLSSEPDLRRWVEEFLAGAERDDFLGTPSPALVSAAIRAGPNDRLTPVAEPGSMFGPFRVVRELGRGGMGQVFLGERASGTFAQLVAIKIVPGAATSDALRRRFLAEQRALARLDHPNVARLVDGGIRDDGTPWFAMEYVDGVRIDRWCDERRLDLLARLRLFLSVCDAVQVAHQRLVVHRDLKPSNIFVAGDGTVRLLDFGVAALLDAEGVGPDATRPEERMFTPEYAAPEQWRFESTTTATDCYALGVILYQLVSGQRPFAFDARPRADWSRIVVEEEPRPPSTAISAEAAAARSTSARHLGRRLRGDLDAIALKALRPDANRRYPTARELADDIRRHLDGEAVAAREGRWTYRVSRFVRRYRIAVGAAAMVLVALSAGLGVAAWQASRAQQAAAESAAVTRFLTGLFLQGAPDQARGDSLTADEMLTRAAADVDSMFPTEPALRTKVLLTVATINRDLGRLGQADTLARKALAVADSFAPERVDAALARGLLGSVARAQGDLGQADSLFVSALALARSIGAPDTLLARLLDGHAYALFQSGRYDEAESKDREALELGDALGPLFVGEVTSNLAVTMTSAAQSRADVGRAAQADSLFRRAAEIFRSAALSTHPVYLEMLSNWAKLMLDRAQPDSARALLQGLVPTLERIYSPEHERVVTAVNSLASADLALGNSARAESGFVRSRAFALRVLGPNHIMAIAPWYNIGKAQLQAGRAAEAEATFRGVLGRMSAREGVEGYLAFGTWLALGRALTAQQRYRETLSTLDSAAALASVVLPADHAGHGEVEIDRAEAWVHLGRPERAEPVARNVLSWRRAKLPGTDLAIGDAEWVVAQAIMGTRATEARRKEAIALAESAAARFRGVRTRAAASAAIDSAVRGWTAQR